MQEQLAKKWKISEGSPLPFGASFVPEGVNFSIYIKEAERVFLCFFMENNLNTPFHEIELDPIQNKTGETWHLRIQGLPPSIVYGYRVVRKESPDSPSLLLDPYAKAVASPPQWNSPPNVLYRPLGKVIDPTPFDWQGDQPPRLPPRDLILYEMHVRGLTRHSSSNVQYPGTYLGVVEKIPYLKELGVNALEILPIHEFNEKEVMQSNPYTKERLCNYFGYSTVNFFSPMNRYASQSIQDHARLEFKTMVRELHKNGIEVILDVVYNHTCEGNEKGPTFSFEGWIRTPIT